MNFYTTAQLGPSRHLLKSGLLLCKNVPIARTGRLLYKDHEIDIKGDNNRVVKIDREASEVFSQSAIDSFNGAAVTWDHPPEPVTPSNWAAYAKGVVSNARRGSGSQSDLLIADLLIHDGESIRRLLEGPDKNPQVSSGYECDYEEIGPALGRQVGIVGNHVAFVKAGRAGPRCAVGDSSKMARKPIKKVTRKHLTVSDRIRVAFETGDTDQLESALGLIEEEEDDNPSAPDIHVHLPASAMAPRPTPQLTIDKETMDVQTVLQTMDARMTGLEGSIATLSKSFTDWKTVNDEKTVTADADNDGKKPTKEELAEKDKKATQDAATVMPTPEQAAALTAAFALAISKGEIMAPGVKMLTFDSAASYQHSLDALKAFQVKALTVALANDETAEVLKPINPAEGIGSLTNDAVAMMFNTAAELVRAHRNKTSNTAPAPAGLLTFNSSEQPNTPAALNKKYAEFSAKHYAH